MKIAICIKGISYLHNYERFDKINTIDFEKSIKNLKKNIFNPLRKKGFELDFFIKTYENEKEKKLLKIYKPKDYKIIPYKKVNNTYLVQAEHLIDLFYMVKKYEKLNNSNYSHVLILRFDIKFTKKFKTFNIDYNKFNISFKCEKNPFIDDCFHLFPRYYMEEYAKILWRHCILRNVRTHDILPFMKIETNFMIEGNYLVRNNPLFKIIRIYK